VKRAGTLVVLMAICLMLSVSAWFRYSGRTEEFLPVSPIRSQEVGAPANEAYRMDLNAASLEDLMTLPGIGETLAGRILEKRGELGGFASVDQLDLVEGIGGKKLDAIRDFVTVR